MMKLSDIPPSHQPTGPSPRLRTVNLKA